jgi:hypothetical protein
MDEPAKLRIPLRATYVHQAPLEDNSNDIFPLPSSLVGLRVIQPAEGFEQTSDVGPSLITQNKFELRTPYFNDATVAFVKT